MADRGVVYRYATPQQWTADNLSRTLVTHNFGATAARHATPDQKAADNFVHVFTSDDFGSATKYTARGNHLIAADGQSAASSGSSTVSGSLGIDTSVSASSAGTSTASAIRLLISSYASSDGSSTVTARMGQRHSVQAMSDGQAATTGSMGNKQRVAGRADGVGTGSGDLVLTRRLVGRSTGLSVVTGDLGREFTLVGSSAGLATVLANLDITFTLPVVPGYMFASTCSGDVTVEHVRGEALFENTLIITPVAATSGGVPVPPTPVVLRAEPAGASKVTFAALDQGSGLLFELAPLGENGPRNGRYSKAGTDKKYQLSWEDNPPNASVPEVLPRSVELTLGNDVQIISVPPGTMFEVDFRLDYTGTEVIEPISAAQQASIIGPNFQYNAGGKFIVMPRIFDQPGFQPGSFFRPSPFTVTILAVRHNFTGGTPPFFLAISGSGVDANGQQIGTTLRAVDGIAGQQFQVQEQTSLGNTNLSFTLYDANTTFRASTSGSPLPDGSYNDLGIVWLDVGDYNDSFTNVLVKCEAVDSLQPPPFITVRDLSARLDELRVAYE